MQYVQTLLDRAVILCGGQAALARQLGTKPPAITEMKKGKRPITPDTAILLADIAGGDPIEAMREARILQPDTGPKADRIRAILGKGKAGGAAAVLLLCLTAPTAYAIANVADKLTMLHIVLIRVSALIKGHAGMLASHIRALQPRYPSPRTRGPRCRSKARLAAGSQRLIAA